MKMRKWYIALLTLLALTACWQESMLPEEGDGNSFDPSKLHFNLTIEHPDGATKGVKKVWKDGDKVFLFINGITTGYLTATLTNTSWTTAYEGTDLASLGASGSLQAVYLPYGNGATPRCTDGQWTFSGGTGGTDTYYFYASEIPYTVSSGILSATVRMKKPMDYVQLFIPCASASGTIQLACNGLHPAGFASIAAADGTVTEKSPGAAGTAVHGYPDTLEGEEGYYVSGKQTSVPDNDYYFALHKADGSYAHYFKRRTQPMVDNKAYKLPAYRDWPTVGSSRTVQIDGKKWKTVNEGASHPWTMGDGDLTASFVPGDGKGLPTASDWDNLLDSNVATWKEMDILGQKGYLVVSVDAPSNYFFLPCNTSSATDYWIDGFGSVVRIDTDGHTNVTPAPAQAYARLVDNLSYFKIKAKLDGTTITSFKHNNGTILYSDDNGGSWNTYAGEQFHLNAGQEVWFRGSLADCNCTGDTQLFTADKVCYIAGDITSLLGNPNTLPTNAFRSAFSFGNISDGNDGLDKEKNLGVANGTVDWVDIDSEDPLILPASTSTNCYVEMFMNCTSLTWAPDLPATTLADKCYFRMFFGCTGLSSIPALPSVVTWNGTSSRQRYCFQMFQGCTGITTLTGSLFGGTMTLAPNCFEDMFAHCTGLTSVDPDFLPATTLAASCYRGMFQDTRFERAPNLLATTLVEYCYRYMFNSCSKLNYIKCLATNPYSSKNDNAYTRDWVGGAVPNSGTFIKNNDEEMTNSWVLNVVYGIHSGWTVYQLKNEPVNP